MAIKYIINLKLIYLRYTYKNIGEILLQAIFQE